MQIGVLGSGAMGTGIAQVAAQAGHDVILFDKNPTAIERAKEKLLKVLNRLVEKGKMTDSEAKGIFGRIYFVDNIYAYKDCGLIIEAIIENLAIKKDVFDQLADIVSKDCILASNTSSLSITSIAGSITNPERFIGIHFFNPAPVMKLVEIIPAMQTTPAIIEQARDLIDSWGKLTVLVKDTPGFIVNRLARPFYGEAIRIYEEGFADFATIDWAMTEVGGFRMGPFTLMDFIGNDVNYAVTESVWKSFYNDPRYKPSFTQKRLSEAGWLGRKTGKGYFDYKENAINPEPNKDKVLAAQIVWRIVVMLINEAADALYLKIASKEDLDLAMEKGVNYPKGLLRWADEKGIVHCVETLDRLFDEYHEERYRCSPLLRNMAREGKKFHSNEAAES